MRVGTQGRRWRASRALVLVALAAASLVGVARPSAAHTPHDDVFDMAVSPQFASDRTVIAISRGLLVRSTDGGASWQRLVKGIDSRTQPHGVSYAGGSTTRVYSVYLNAVYRSNDGGTSWTKVLTPAVGDLRLLATSSASPDTVVVAGSSAGASITTDGGTTWRPLGATGARITAVGFKPGSQQVIFAGDAIGVLHVTGNTGASWRSYPMPAGGAITAIAVSPRFSTDNIAMVGTSTGGIFRWDHAAKVATAVNTGLSDLQVTSLGHSAIYAFDGRVYATTWNGGVFVSTDQGLTWSASNSGLEWHSQASTPAFADRPNFGRVTSVLTDPLTWGTTAFVAGFTGLYASTDLGGTWQLIETLSTSTIMGLALSPQYATDQTVALSTYVNGSFVSSNGGGSWSESNLGMAQSGFWDYQPDAYARAHNIVFAPPGGTQPWLYNSVAPYGGARGGVLRSANGGASWSLTLVPGFSDPGVESETARIPFVLASPSFASDHSVLMADGGNGAVYRSTDEGASFAQVGTIPLQPKCLQASPTFATDGRIYACTSGGVYVSTDLGATWTPTKVLSIQGLTVLVRTGVSETWFAATTNGLYRSTDRGTSWARLSLPAPVPTASEVLAVAASPPSSAPGTVLVSIRGRGLLRSTDGGATFTTSTNLLDVSEQLDNFPYKPTAAPIVFSPAFSTDQTIFGYSHDHLFKSVDGGSTWQRVLFPRATHTGPMPTIPAPPTIGAATASTDAASVTFTPSADGGTPITRFDATCTSTNGGATATGFAAASPILVSGLTGGKTYTCRVTATNLLGTSNPSSTSNAVGPQSPPGVPGTPTATPAGGSATVTWAPPASDGGSPITGYSVQPFVGFFPLTPVVFASTATSQVVSGLTNGVQYRFRVAAINAVGTGAASSPSNLVTPMVATPGAPSTPTAVAGVGEVTLTWSAPLSDGGSPLVGYSVQAFVGYFPLAPVVFSSTATTQVLTGLTPGVTYRFRVSAVNALGTGLQSGISNAVTPA